MIDRLTPPTAKTVEHVKLATPDYHLLDNGVELFAMNSGTQEVVRLEFVFDAGTKYQGKKLVASVTNKLITEGALGKSSHEIAEEVDYYGAFLQTDLSKDHGSIVLYCLEKQLNNLLPVVKSIITGADFSEAELQTHLTNSRQKFIVDNEKVASIARKRLNQLLFAEHPYGVTAEETDFDKVTRDDIIEFYNESYNLSNCKIFLSGKFNEDLIEKIKKEFGQIEARQNTKGVINDIVKSPQGKSDFVKKQDAIQSGIRIGKLIANKKHKDYHGLQVLNTVLGGYFGSRLMSNIREDKGYTYGIGSVLVSFENAGYFAIATEVGSEVTQATMKEIEYELNRLREVKIKEEELELVRSYMLGSFLKNIDGPFNVMDRFKGLHYYGLDYSYYDDFLDTIKNISSEMLLDLAQKHLDSDTFIKVIVGKGS